MPHPVDRPKQNAVSSRSIPKNQRRSIALAIGYSIPSMTLLTALWTILPIDRAFPFLPSSALAQTVEDRKAEADRLLQQGIQQYRVNQFREALQSLEAALQIYREIGDRQGEGMTLAEIGIAYFNVGQYQRAIELHEQALGIAREIGDRALEGTIAVLTRVRYSNNSL